MDRYLLLKKCFVARLRTNPIPVPMPLDHYLDNLILTLHDVKILDQHESDVIEPYEQELSVLRRQIKNIFDNKKVDALRVIEVVDVLGMDLEEVKE